MRRVALIALLMCGTAHAQPAQPRNTLMDMGVFAGGPFVAKSEMKGALNAPSGIAGLDASGSVTGSIANAPMSPSMTGGQAASQIAANAQAISGKASVSDVRFTQFNVKAPPFAAKGDGKWLTDVSTTAGSTTVTSASYQFTAADIGKMIRIQVATGTAVGIFSSKISNVANGAAILASAPTVTKTGSGTPCLSPMLATCPLGTTLFGTDDAPAFQAAVNAASAAGGGAIVMPSATYILSETINWASRVSMTGNGAGNSIVAWISTSDQTSGMFSGIAGSATAPYADVQFTNFEADDEAATQATYNLAGKVFFFQFMARPLFDGLYIHGAPATCIGTDYLFAGRIHHNVLSNCGRLSPLGGAGGSGIGIGTYSSVMSDGSSIDGNTVYSPYTAHGNYSILVESQQGQSIASYTRIVNNLVYLLGSQQKGYGLSGAMNTIAANNQAVCNGQTAQRGFSVDTGTLPTASADAYGRASENIARNCDIGFYYDGSGSGQYTPTPFAFDNNSASGSLRYGLWIHGGASISLDGLTINGGAYYNNGGPGIYLDGTAPIKHLTINNVKAFANGTSMTAQYQGGLVINVPIAGLSMHGDEFYDLASSGKQLYGVIVNGVAVSDVFATGNKFSGNTTGALQVNGGSFTGWLADNRGYNPLGTATVTPSGSPWTYTAGSTPEVLYLSGGTVSSVTKNGLALGVTSGPVKLSPGDTATVTYTSAPAAVVDRQ